MHHSGVLIWFNGRLEIRRSQPEVIPGVAGGVEQSLLKGRPDARIE